MNYVSGPKAVNIIRPSNQNKPGGIALKPHDLSKKKKPFLNLYDPKQQQAPPLLKKPILELYNKQPIPNHYIPEKKPQTLLSEKALLIHNKQLEDLSVISTDTQLISSNNSISSSSSSSDSEDEDARINRKVCINIFFFSGNYNFGR